MLSIKDYSPAQASRFRSCRYYLHIVSDCTVHLDERGAMLSDLADAHRYAISLVWHCMRCATEEQNWRGWRVEIADDIGQILVVVPFTTIPSAHWSVLRDCR